MSLSIALLPGDVISVPKAGMFYVEGVVANPGAYPLLDDTTVSEAVATAGGADRTLANASGTLLYRKRDDGKREAMTRRTSLTPLSTFSTSSLTLAAKRPRSASS